MLVRSKGRLSEGGDAVTERLTWEGKAGSFSLIKLVDCQGKLTHRKQKNNCFY